MEFLETSPGVTTVLLVLLLVLQAANIISALLMRHKPAFSQEECVSRIRQEMYKEFVRNPALADLRMQVTSDVQHSLSEKLHLDYARAIDLAQLRNDLNNRMEGNHASLVDLRNSVQESMKDINRTLGKLERAS